MNSHITQPGEGGPGVRITISIGPRYTWVLSMGPHVRLLAVFNYSDVTLADDDNN